MAKRIGPQHKRYAAWFERRRGPRDRADEAALLRVADAYDEATTTGSLTAKRLQCVVDGVSSQRALLWSNASDLLGLMSGTWQAAADAILEMMRSRKSHVRFAALCSLSKKTPPAITDAALLLALKDKASRVRWKAVDRALTLERRALISEIEVALDRETDRKVRRSMELHLRMLRDGHWVRSGDSRGWWEITARRDNGIVSREVSDKELRSRGLESILAELRGH